jgi:DNA-binding SARP family transcriptional activator
MRFQVLILVFIALFLSFCSNLYAQGVKPELNYGLNFASHEVTKDQRTSLNLNPNAPFILKEDFEIKFDLSLLRLTNAYGYVLRIIANDTLNIDLVSSPEHVEFYDLNLILKNTGTNLHYDFTDVNLKPQQWTSIIIEFSYIKNQISISWNGKKKSQPFPMSKLESFRFLFGANDFNKFTTSDAPPMSLRNIEILKSNLTLYKWDFKKHHVNEVYDSIHEQIATVKNPIWLVDQHTKWIRRTQFSIGKYPSITFDSNAGVLYATDEGNVYTLNITSGKIDKTRFSEGSIIHTDANQLLYIEETNSLVNYDVITKKFSPFNFDKKKWANKDTTYHEPIYWHNNKFYNPIDSSLYVFGGYGFFSYKNTFFKYDNHKQEWLPVNTSGSIPPRYLAASGVRSSRNEVLIFGGYGSMTGKQELLPKSFYDLYSFNLKNHEVKKIWELHTKENSEDIVFSNSMVINEKDSCFYVLSFPKNKFENFIKLRSYSLTKPESTLLADSIPFRFHDEHSFSDLFFSKPGKELIAVTVHKENEHYKVDIYSINYPPLNAHDVLQTPKVTPTRASVYYYIAIICAFAFLAIYLLIRKLQLKKTKQEVISNEDIAIQIPNDREILRELSEEKPLSTINLFGGFQVFDKSGQDITGKFTSTLKELFVLILLHSVKYEKGISTTVLQEYLWPDKDETSARNNRNVNIKKLRTLLEEIGDITIENNNSYLHLVINENIFCDYQTAYKILNSGNLERQKIEILLKYVKRGSLLPNIQTEWLDSFKSDISNKIIDVLLAYSTKLDVHKDDKILLEIADSIFNYDTINQEAMVLKCSVLNKKGKHSLAKNWYDHFVKEYKNLYGENYPRTFEEVVS